MKQITKNQEPRSLVQHRANGGTYDNLPKDELRRTLLAEQGHICCYCMKRIPQKLNQKEIDKSYPNCKIEHINCQSQNREQELNYLNMLLACNGNHGFPRIMQTCDTYKGEMDLSFNPSDTNRNIENLIRYRSNGEIFSDDETIDNELNNVLNLNTKNLSDARAIYYKNIQTKIIFEGKKRKGKNIQKHFYEKEKQNLLTLNNGKFTQYCMVGVYLIDKKLSKLN
jgi:uncharacterized protein (TIGR02646 family)